MIRNRTFFEVLAAVAVLCCVIIPTALWVYFSVKAGKMETLPEGLTLFVTAANGTVLGLLGLKQFAPQDQTDSTKQ